MFRETDKPGREPWHVQFLPKGKEDNSEGMQEMSSPSPRKVCGEGAQSVRSICFPI